jgi:hypothetical protein
MQNKGFAYFLLKKVVVVSASGLQADFCIVIYSFYYLLLAVCKHLACGLLAFLIAVCLQVCWHFASTLRYPFLLP